MILDCHSHYARPLTAKIGRMDAAGIDRAVLVVATGNPETALDADDYAVETANARRHIGWDGSDAYVQDAFAETVRCVAPYRDRFILLAPVVFGGDRRGIEAWTTAALDAGCHGFGEVMPPSGGAASIDTAAAVAHDAGGMMFLTSSYPPTSSDDVRALGELARRYPANRFVLGHLGAGHTLAACEVANARPNVFIDTSTHPNIIAFRRCLADAPDRLVFGTNDPYCDPEIALLGLARLVRDTGLRRQIAGARCEQLLSELGAVRRRPAA